MTYFLKQNAELDWLGVLLGIRRSEWAISCWPTKLAVAQQPLISLLFCFLHGFSSFSSCCSGLDRLHFVVLLVV